MDVAYDIINTVQRTEDAIAFSAADWALVAYLPGRVNFTGHTRTLTKGPITSANATFALYTPGAQAGVLALFYDANGQQVWVTLGTVTHAGPNNVQLLRVDIKPTLDAIFSGSYGAFPPGITPYCYVTAQVKGTGSLYMARLEINWDVTGAIAA